MTTPLRYNFVIPDDSGFTLDELRKGTLEDFAELYIHGEYCWGLQTFKVLQNSNLQVALSCAYDPEAINLAHVNASRKLKPRSDCFLVSMPADFPQYPLAQFHVVQNKDQDGANSPYIPLWPQVGQIARRTDRNEITVVAYQGRISFTDLDEDQLNADLKPLGMKFTILDGVDWRDLTEVDILVGIRSFGKKEYKRKPPSKLINAWHAGIPFVGGWDSAFAHIGTSGEDYIRVSTYEELLDAIIRIKTEPGLYEKMVEAGRKKAPDFTFDAMSQLWQDVLSNEVCDAFNQWRRNPPTRLAFQKKWLKYVCICRLRNVAQKLYTIPIIKTLRDRYYDPAK